MGLELGGGMGSGMGAGGGDMIPGMGMDPASGMSSTGQMGGGMTGGRLWSLHQSVMIKTGSRGTSITP